MDTTLLAYIPSPSQGVWHLGPVPVRAYALCIIVGIIVAVWWGDRRWRARGGQPGDVLDVALWAVPFGVIGGRIYHVLTDWSTYFGDGGKGISGAVGIWDGGLGIWGAIAFGAVGAWIGCRWKGIKLPSFADALAPGILLAQAIGRLGNYFNQELFGEPTTLPWGLEIYQRVDEDGRVGHGLVEGVSTGEIYQVVHPTFLYELLWNVLIVILLVVVDRLWKVGHGRLFALYVAGYCVGRFGIELMRTDPATEILGLRINLFTSAIVFLLAALYFLLAPRGRETGLSMYWPKRAEELAEFGEVGYIPPELDEDELDAAERDSEAKRTAVGEPADDEIVDVSAAVAAEPEEPAESEEPGESEEAGAPEEAGESEEAGAPAADDFDDEFVDMDEPIAVGPTAAEPDTEPDTEPEAAADAVASEEGPADEAPAGTATTEDASVGDAPEESAPEESAPEESAAEESAAEESAADPDSVEAAPAEDAPAVEPDAEDAGTGETGAADDTETVTAEEPAAEKPAAAEPVREESAAAAIAAVAAVDAEPAAEPAGAVPAEEAAGEPAEEADEEADEEAEEAAAEQAAADTEPETAKVYGGVTVQQDPRSKGSTIEIREASSGELASMVILDPSSDVLDGELDADLRDAADAETSVREAADSAAAERAAAVAAEEAAPAAAAAAPESDTEQVADEDTAGKSGRRGGRRARWRRKD